MTPLMTFCLSAAVTDVVIMALLAIWVKMYAGGKADRTIQAWFESNYYRNACIFTLSTLAVIALGGMLGVYIMGG